MAFIQKIEDPQDPRIAPYRDIRERDLTGRQGRFIAEGEVVLRVLGESSPHRALSVLIDGKRLDKLAPILDALPPETPVYVASGAVVDAIAGFPLHRGILAIGERGPPLSPDALLASAPERAVVLVLHGIGNHDNMGGLFRNAAAFGAHAVLLDPTSCDPLYRKAIRVSVGAALHVPFARLGQGEDAVALLEAHGFQPLALSPSGGTTLAALCPPPRRCDAGRRGTGPAARPDGARHRRPHPYGAAVGLAERRHHLRYRAASFDAGLITVGYNCSAWAMLIILGRGRRPGRKRRPPCHVPVLL